MSLTRRKFMRRALQAGGVLASGVGLGIGYGFWEASDIRIRRATVPVPNLPPAFVGKTIGVLTDFHLGPFVGIGFIRAAVRMANALQPDLFALVGDFAHKGRHAERDVPACLEALAELRAPLGVFAVPGNHDLACTGQVYREAVATTPLIDLTNRHRRVRWGGADLWLAGVDDLWWGQPDIAQALDGIPEGAAVVLLSHNPDYAEQAREARVGLMLSGHTHGGQIYLPVLGCPWMPSQYGEKYRGGLVQAPAFRVFVSRGIGEAGVPIRFSVPPEINLLTLSSA